MHIFSKYNLCSCWVLLPKLIQIKGSLRLSYSPSIHFDGGTKFKALQAVTVTVTIVLHRIYKVLYMYVGKAPLASLFYILNFKMSAFIPFFVCDFFFFLQLTPSSSNIRNIASENWSLKSSKEECLLVERRVFTCWMELDWIILSSLQFIFSIIFLFLFLCLVWDQMDQESNTYHGVGDKDHLVWMPVLVRLSGLETFKFLIQLQGKGVQVGACKWNVNVNIFSS